VNAVTNEAVVSATVVTIIASVEAANRARAKAFIALLLLFVLKLIIIVPLATNLEEVIA